MAGLDSQAAAWGAVGPRATDRAARGGRRARVASGRQVEDAQYKFFVKASILQVNGFAQCATTYWTPGAMDLSINVNNAHGVMVILTAYVSN